MSYISNIHKGLKDCANLLLEAEMKNRRFMTGILAFVLVWGMAVVGCDNGTTDDNGITDSNGNDNGEDLPKASGVNALSGKTYYQGNYRIVFSATANDAANGTYTGSRDEEIYEIGAYSWNEEKKTVTLNAEKIFTSESDTLVDKTDYRKILQIYYDSLKEEMGEAAFNQFLQESGLSITDAMNFELNMLFSNKTQGYSFSTDGTALFLLEMLPANKGVNELSGQTYHGVGYDGDATYIFTTSGYTKSSTRETITGSYTYDSNEKRVFFRQETIDGKDRSAYYDEERDRRSSPDNANAAAQTNQAFRFYAFFRSDETVEFKYNSIDKTIGR